jgi:hypothetical protein
MEGKVMTAIVLGCSCGHAVVATTWSEAREEMREHRADGSGCRTIREGAVSMPVTGEHLRVWRRELVTLAQVQGYRNGLEGQPRVEMIINGRQLRGFTIATLVSAGMWFLLGLLCWAAMR